MKNNKIIKLFLMIFLLLGMIISLFYCKNNNIIGNWNVVLKYKSTIKKYILPENSIFRFQKNYSFYINGKKTTGKYTKKGDIIRVFIKKRAYVIRGILVDSNTIKGEVKKILTDNEIATWVAKRSK